MTDPVLAVVNARIWTGEPSRPWADALTVAGDRFAHVGSSAEVRKRIPRSARVADARVVDARVVDARGGFIAPGLIDSHIHFLQGGFGLSSVQLRDARTPAEFTKRIAEHARRLAPGTWITHGDWDHERWGGALPHRDWLDAATPDHPVWVNRLDSHMSLANGAALRAANVGAHTPDVDGGTIVRGHDGEPTGVLKDRARELIDRGVPHPSRAQEDAALDAAMRYVAAQGVTAVHHVGTWEDLEVFDRAHRDRRLMTRLYAAVPLASWMRLRDAVAARGAGDAWLRIGALKGFVDGSLGSRTAAMLEPFDDAPNDRGLLVIDPGDLHAWCAAADAAGLHLIVHAIGDRAIRLLLDVYERIALEQLPRDRRWRIEHAQHIAPIDLARFARLDVIASMQPYHLIDDGRWAERAIGAERARGTYAIRSLLDSGARVAFGSDWPVAPATPLEGIYAAVTRRTLDGAHPDGWHPEQRIGVEDALRAYTSAAAFAGFSDAETGTIARGKLADFVMLDRDITSIAPEEIAEARVLMTAVGGRIVHENT